MSCNPDKTLLFLIDINIKLNKNLDIMDKTNMIIVFIR